MSHVDGHGIIAWRGHDLCSEGASDRPPAIDGRTILLRQRTRGARRAPRRKRSGRRSASECENMLKAKLGIAPIAWWNDDLAELSDDVSLEECLRQASVAGS